MLIVSIAHWEEEIVALEISLTSGVIQYVFIPFFSGNAPSSGISTARSTNLTEDDNNGKELHIHPTNRFGDKLRFATELRRGRSKAENR